MKFYCKDIVIEIERIVCKFSLEKVKCKKDRNDLMDLKVFIIDLFGF